MERGKGERTTWGLAKYGQSEVQSAAANIQSSVRAGQATLNILFLTSTKYFQSAEVVGGRNSFSRTSPSPVRCTSP